MTVTKAPWRHAHRILGFATLVSTALGLAGSLLAQSPAHPATTVQGPLSREVALHMALVSNPFLMAVRQQSGFGEAAVVIAKTYPFNPVYTGYITSANGPP